MTSNSPPAIFLLLFSTVLLLLLLQLSSTVSAIGINYGTIANNLPPPAEVANFIKTKTIIDSIKIFDTNPEILKAFANTGIYVTVTVGNGDIPALSDLGAAKQWVNNNIAPYHPATKINHIAVGNEIIMSGNQDWIRNLVPCMKSLNTALLQAGIRDIKISTPHTLGILYHSVPPSSARIRPGYQKSIFAPMLQFLRETKSPLMVNPYPYFSYAPKVAKYTLFKPNRGIYDRYTKIQYRNMFDAMMDAVYSAIKAMGYADLEIMIAETGWPSAGDPNQPPCTVENAVAYNGYLIKHVSSGKGTPLMPNRKFPTFIFALFNENLKPGSSAEKNWGLFRPDFSPVYDVGIMRNQQGNSPNPNPNPKPTPKPRRRRRARPSPNTGAGGGGGRGGGRGRGRARARPSPNTGAGAGGGGGRGRARAAPAGKKWCVAKVQTTEPQLQASLDWACSHGADCKPIQEGGSCFAPNNVREHASYAMNSYFQTHGKSDTSCDFSSTADLTTTDPSHGGCKFP
ncbi:glucan endo-1,3-beta-glucosidase-like [Euphorbia lathyris]|uniref:glucan endo-1,3-beta-glucosidase-like n=1 Tax=Euphorbia lathyris TaxID=212925 RepID=UPI0033140086